MEWLIIFHVESRKAEEYPVLYKHQLALKYYRGHELVHFESTNHQKQIPLGFNIYGHLEMINYTLTDDRNIGKEHRKVRLKDPPETLNPVPCICRISLTKGILQIAISNLHP